MITLNVLTEPTAYGNIFGIEGLFNFCLSEEKRDIKYLQNFIKENSLRLDFIGFVTTQYGLVKNYDILNYDSVKTPLFCEKVVPNEELNASISMCHFLYPSLKNTSIVEAWYVETGERDLIKTDIVLENGLDEFIKYLEYNIINSTHFDFI